MTVVRGGILRPLDRHEPGPVRSTLGGFRDDELAFFQLVTNARLRPSELFDHLVVAPLDKVPMLAGLSLRPIPAADLRRAMAAAGRHGVILNESQAETVAVSMIREHRRRADRNQVSQMFNNWLRHAFNLGAEAAPLLHREWVERETKLTLARIDDLAATGKAAA